MAARRPRRQEEEEHENHERWLVTYADMVTLLMVLFIVMFAMSSVDEKKFSALRSGLASGFGQSTSVLKGSTSLLAQSGTSTVAPVGPGDTIGKPTGASGAGTAAEAVSKEKAREEEQQHADAEAEVDRLQEIQKELQAALRSKGLESDVQASFDERGLVLSLVSRHVVFDNNRAELSARGEEVVDVVGSVLIHHVESLEISGHTNQASGDPKYYPTDWDLSAARALTVLRRFNEMDGLPDDRLSLSAFGHTRPLVPTSQPGSQQINKRVDIVVLSPSESTTRELLAEVAAAEAAASRDGAAGTDPQGDT